MIVPPFLKQGDTLGIVAPGRKVSEENLAASIQTFQEWGLKVILGANIFSDNHSYLGGSDQERLKDIQEMINNPTVKAIICARGGYGTSRIIDAIDFSALERNPKWVVGFSDITAIHLKLHSRGFSSIHGTMPILFSKPDSASSVSSLKNALFGFPSPINSVPSPYNKPGTGEGPMIGGNLSLIVDSMGTSTEPDTRGKILFIEEIDEYLYKIDRMMNHLKRAGKLQHLHGLIVGHLTNIMDTDLSFGQPVEGIILEHTKAYNYPVVFQFPSGHENPNLAWSSGSHYILKSMQEKSELTPC